MRKPVASRSDRRRWLGKRLVFALLRTRQPVWVFDSRRNGTGSRLRVVHVGSADRGRAFIQGLYATYPQRVRLGHAWIGPTPRNGTMALPDHDLLLVEINRLYAERYRQAGFVTIPEWVEFGRPVVADRGRRYSGACKSLKCDLKAIRQADCRVVVTRDPADFELFYRQMYLPHLTEHFGDSAIRKSRRRIERDFKEGFLLVLEKEGRRLAAAIVRVNGEEVSETTLGVASGANGSLGASASGLIDFHLHEWAAQQGKRYLRVGHTRPFPLDGVYFNKRKWQMTIVRDDDGVMDMAVKVPRAASFPLEVFEEFPFVYAVPGGLGALGAHRSERALDLDETQKVLKRVWTDGLKSLILICPGGFRPCMAQQFEKRLGCDIHLCSALGEALEVYRARGKGVSRH